MRAAPPVSVHARGGSGWRALRALAPALAAAVCSAWALQWAGLGDAAAAGIAGADSIGSTPFDAILGEPSSLGRRVARNTHHVLMEECHLHRVNDPAGGSWYIERLTDELAARFAG